MEDLYSFGTWVQRRRRSLVITQAELARRIGVATVTLQKIEADERRPSSQVAALLADQLCTVPSERTSFLSAARGQTPVDQLAPPVWPHLPLPPEHRSAIPIPPNALLGRAEELTRLTALLTQGDVRLVTLTGPGGVGKTRLAIAAVTQERLSEHFPDPIWWVDLAPVRDAEHVASALLAGVGVNDLSGMPARERLLSWLGSRHLLLVLDNFEHLIAATAFIGEILRAAPGVRILATSRTALRLTGEHEYSVEALTPEASVQLFVERARAVRPDAVHTKGHREDVGAICARLDRLPLAIELAAAQSKLFTLAELREHLTRHGALTLPISGPRDLPARQQRIYATLQWSNSLIEPMERALLARLGVFVGSFPRDAVEAIAGGWEPAGSVNELSVAAALGTLLDYSLVRSTRDPEDGTRFVLLETVREFALEQLADRGELTATRQRHAAYMLTYAETVETQLVGHEVQQVLARVRADMPNMRAAFQWTRDVGDWDTAARLSAALSEVFLLEQTYLIEGAGWLRLCLEHGPELTESVRAKAGVCFGRIQGRVQHDPWIEDVIAESLAIAERRGDARGIARAIVVRSEQAWRNGNLTAAQADAEDGLARSVVAEDQVAQSWALFGLGWTLGSAGEYAEAQRIFERGLAICRSSGYTHATADMLLGLAEIAFFRDAIADAESYTWARLDVEQRLGNPVGIGSCYEALGALTYCRGGYADAIAHFEQALHLYDLHMPPYAVQARAWLNSAAALVGDCSRARRYGRDAFERVPAVSSPGAVITSTVRDVAGLTAAAAALALCCGKLETAIRLCGSLGHISAEPASLMYASPADAQFRTHVSRRAQSRLGDDERFERLKAEGSKLTPEQAEAEAWLLYMRDE